MNNYLVFNKIVTPEIFNDLHTKKINFLTIKEDFYYKKFKVINLLKNENDWLSCQKSCEIVLKDMIYSLITSFTKIILIYNDVLKISIALKIKSDFLDIIYNRLLSNNLCYYMHNQLNNEVNYFLEDYNFDYSTIDGIMTKMSSFIDEEVTKVIIDENVDIENFDFNV